MYTLNVFNSTSFSVFKVKEVDSTTVTSNVTRAIMITCAGRRSDILSMATYICTNLLWMDRLLKLTSSGVLRKIAFTAIGINSKATTSDMVSVATIEIPMCSPISLTK